MFIDKYIEEISKALDHLYGNPIVAIVLTAFMVIATYTDVLQLKIPNKLNGAFLISRFVLIPWLGFSIWDVVGAVVCFIALLIPAMVKMQKMGGDIKCVTVLGLYAGIALAPPFLLLSCAYFVVVNFLRFIIGKKTGLLPFAPFFLASNITLMIIYYGNVL